LGDLSPVPEQALAFVSGGHVIANALTSAAGEAELPAGLELTSIGVYRVTGPEPIDPLAAVEQRVMVVRPDAAPLVIFDADLPDEALRGLIDFRARRGQPETTLMAVRLRPAHSCRSIRHRLRALGLPPIVLDARAVLDEGEAFDVSDSFDALRLGRWPSICAEPAFASRRWSMRARSSPRSRASSRCVRAISPRPRCRSRARAPSSTRAWA